MQGKDFPSAGGVAPAETDCQSNQQHGGKEEKPVFSQRLFLFPDFISPQRKHCGKEQRIPLHGAVGIGEAEQHAADVQIADKIA